MGVGQQQVLFADVLPHYPDMTIGADNIMPLCLPGIQTGATEQLAGDVEEDSGTQ